MPPRLREALDAYAITGDLAVLAGLSVRRAALRRVLAVAMRRRLGWPEIDAEGRLTGRWRHSATRGAYWRDGRLCVVDLLACPVLVSRVDYAIC